MAKNNVFMKRGLVIRVVGLSLPTNTIFDAFRQCAVFAVRNFGPIILAPKTAKC